MHCCLLLLLSSGTRLQPPPLQPPLPPTHLQAEAHQAAAANLLVLDSFLLRSSQEVVVEHLEVLGPGLAVQLHTVVLAVLVGPGQEELGLGYVKDELPALILGVFGPREDIDGEPRLVLRHTWQWWLENKLTHRPTAHRPPCQRQDR